MPDIVPLSEQTITNGNWRVITGRERRRPRSVNRFIKSQRGKKRLERRREATWGVNAIESKEAAAPSPLV